MQMILNKIYPKMQNQPKSPKNTESRVSRPGSIVDFDLENGSGPAYTSTCISSREIQGLTPMALT
jgi:hypothetical protein